MPATTARAKLRKRKYSRRLARFHRAALTIGSEGRVASVVNACIEPTLLCFANHEHRIRQTHGRHTFRRRAITIS
jgi:hypothetical protein